MDVSIQFCEERQATKTLTINEGAFREWLNDHDCPEMAHCADCRSPIDPATATSSQIAEYVAEEVGVDLLGIHEDSDVTILHAAPALSGQPEADR